MKSVIDQLASFQGRRDEVPNQELAARIVDHIDTEAIEELVSLLHHKTRDIQSDAIKVLYEIGERNPSLIASHASVFLELLDHKNNRMVWGAMTSLDSITSLAAPFIYVNLPRIISASDRGSIIAKDHLIGILVKLAMVSAYTSEALSLLLDQMQNCPTNQLPMYAENSVQVITGDFKTQFVKMLSDRLNEIEKESKRKRVQKVISQLRKSNTQS